MQTEDIELHYVLADQNGDESKRVSMAVDGDAGYLPDVLATMAEFLRSAGFTFVDRLSAFSDGPKGLIEYRSDASQTMFA